MSLSTLKNLRTNSKEIANKKELIKKIEEINNNYDNKWLESCSEVFLNKLLIDNMIISQGYGNTLNRHFN